MIYLLQLTWLYFSPRSWRTVKERTLTQGYHVNLTLWEQNPSFLLWPWEWKLKVLSKCVMFGFKANRHTSQNATTFLQPWGVHPRIHVSVLFHMNYSTHLAYSLCFGETPTHLIQGVLTVACMPSKSESIFRSFCCTRWHVALKMWGLLKYSKLGACGVHICFISALPIKVIPVHCFPWSYRQCALKWDWRGRLLVSFGPLTVLLVSFCMSSLGRIFC